MCNLTDQTAIVTGGAQGIGLGIASELARAGCIVVIGDRDLDKARGSAEHITKEGGKATALLVDVTDDRSVQACVEESIARFLRVDVLVNNAGVHCESIHQVSTIDQFERCFDVNLYGVWRMTQALVPHFRAQRGGKIINISSINGKKPWAETPAYSASKAAVINLTKSLAMSLSADGINVNAVCPGGVMTAMANAFMCDLPQLQDQLIDSRLLKRPLLPEDIGRAVVFFASDSARNITGQSLNVDGGYLLS